MPDAAIVISRILNNSRLFFEGGIRGKRECQKDFYSMMEGYYYLGDDHTFESFFQL